MRNNQSLKSLVAPFILVAATCFNQASATDNPFQGNWAYQQICGLQHVASVRLQQKGSEVSGSWDDGSTRASGTYGQLKGNVINGQLRVRYCGGDDSSDYSVCPNYEAEASDYFVRQGKDLIWYKMTAEKSGNTFQKYLVLHPAIHGKPTITDNHCPDN